MRWVRGRGGGPERRLLVAAKSREPCLGTSCWLCWASLAAAVGALAVAWGVLKPPADEVRRICEASVWFKDNPAASILATDANVRAYAEACYQVWPSLNEEVQNLLWKRWNNGTFDAMLPSPPVCPPVCMKRVNASPPSCGSQTLLGKPRKADNELSRDLDVFQHVAERPLRIPDIAVAEIPEMFKVGEVGKFDATALFPRHMFNATLEQIAALHKDTANETSVYGFKSFGDEPVSKMVWKGAGVCERLLGMATSWVYRLGTTSPLVRLIRLFVVPWLLRQRCYPPFSLAEVAQLSKNFPPDEAYLFRISDARANRKIHKRLYKFRKKNQAMESSNVHLRHLPQFAGDMDVSSLLRLESVVEREYSYLWIGTSIGSFHMDAQDNILAQLTEEVEYLVFPSNCSSSLLVDDFLHHPDFDEDEVMHAIQRRQLPFYHGYLRSGEGLVIPSNSLHKVVSRRSQRLGINTFFEPKYGEMQWPATPGNYYRMQDPAVSALRFLWARSLAQLWESKRAVIAMHTSKLPYI